MKRVGVYPFTAIVGQEDMKLSLILNVINPALGGVLIKGEQGTAKSTAVRALAELLPAMPAVKGCQFHCDPAEPEKAMPAKPTSDRLADCTNRELAPVPASTRTRWLTRLPDDSSRFFTPSMPVGPMARIPVNAAMGVDSGPKVRSGYCMTTLRVALRA